MIWRSHRREWKEDGAEGDERKGVVFSSSCSGHYGAEQLVWRACMVYCRAWNEERDTHIGLSIRPSLFGALCLHVWCGMQLTHIGDRLGLPEGDCAASCGLCRLSGREGKVPVLTEV